MEIIEIKCEQYNVNDDNYNIIDVLCNNGDIVKTGQVLFELDSSKALIEVESKLEGYFYTIYNKDESISVNSTLYLISKKQIENIESFFEKSKSGQKDFLDNEKVFTNKAKEFIEKNKIDVSKFEESFITLELLQNKFGLNNMILDNCNTNKIKRVAIIGAGRGLVQILDIIFNSTQYIPVCIYDDTPEKQNAFFFNIPVVGLVNPIEILNDFENNKFDLIINSVSTSIEFRKSIFKKLKAYQIPFANLVHKNAIIGFNVNLGEGNVILADVVVGASTIIGNDNFISSKCNIEHHNILANHITFGPNVVTSGSVEISDEVKFGTGIFIEPKITIGENSIISSGSIITRNIPSNTIVMNESSNLKFKTIFK